MFDTKYHKLDISRWFWPAAALLTHWGSFSVMIYILGSKSWFMPLEGRLSNGLSIAWELL